MTKHDTIASRFNIIDSSVFPIPDDLESSFPYPADFKKRASKIWRKTYDREDVDFCDDDAPKDVHMIFTNPFALDVTSEYITKNIKLDDYIYDRQYIYLCTYLTGRDWTPVACSTNGTSFGLINDSTVYLLAYYKDKCLMPIDNPMIVESHDKKRVLEPDMANMMTLTVDRKYPLVGKFIDRWAQMRGGRFEGSDTPTFNNPATIAEITTTPIYRNVYTVNTDKAYRYIRYISPGNINFPITEIEVYAGGKKN